MKVLLRNILFFICLLLPLGSFALENPFVLNLQGYLGKEEVEKAVDSLQKSKSDLLVLDVNSTSGDLNEVLRLARRIYEWKTSRNIPVVVYLNENAIGPAAVFPFLADEFILSLFVSWGDIPLGNEGMVSTNLLWNRVTSLISDKHPQSALLNVLAKAMVDKTVVVVDNNGWKIAADAAEAAKFPIVSVQGQTLVVNQKQLQKLGLAKETLTQEQFKTRYKQEIVSVPVVSAEGNIEKRLQEAIKFNPEGVNNIGYITIDDRSSSINQSTWLYVKTALEAYKKSKPLFIILELNTPGGEVFAAQKISDALKELDTQYNIPVVTFINNWAISAGAMIAYSTRFITIVKDASMGAAEPILATQEGKTETASEKVNSALRADFSNRAAFFGRNPLLAEAMVDKEIILVKRHGKIVKLDTEAQIRTTGPDPDIVITPKGKLLTLDAAHLMDYGVADILLQPAKLDLITAEEREKGKWPASKMLLFQHPFFKQIPNATMDVFLMDWKIRFFSFLANPIVSSLLFLGLLISFYIEMNTPGFGLAGSVGLICLFLIILSSFALEAASWLELIFLAAGIIILVVDLTVLPTFGLLGIVGVMLMLAGLFGLLLPGLSSVSFDFDTKTFNAAGEFVLRRLFWLSLALLVGLVIISLLARYIMPKFSAFNRFVLAGHEQDASAGYIAGDNPKTLPQPGSKGTVVSTLRPSGKVMIQDIIYDAISTGDYIEQGEEIEVSLLDGSVIVVKKSEPV